MQDKLSYLNGTFDGDELCPYCGFESHFKIKPLKKVMFKCEHCKEEILPCSLCDSNKCGDTKDCQKNICESLWEYYCAEVKNMRNLFK